MGWADDTTISGVIEEVFLGGKVSFEEVKCLRILGVTLGFKLTFETHLREIVTEAGWVSCAKQESNLIVHVYSRAVSMHIFYPA